jgi:hypothetical protein
MTFKEFFNKQDSHPITASIKPPIHSGLKVVRDLAKTHGNPEFFTSPKAPKPHLPKQPLSLGPYSRPVKDRPIENKPTDFLARKKKTNTLTY